MDSWCSVSAKKTSAAGEQPLASMESCVGGIIFVGDCESGELSSSRGAIIIARSLHINWICLNSLWSKCWSTLTIISSGMSLGM